MLRLKILEAIYFYCIVAASPFSEENGEVSSVILDFKNITERKENEKRFAHYRRQLRTTASELSLTEERERRRLATNLHDSVSQTLFVTKMQTSALLNEYTAQDKKNSLKEIYNHIDQALTETRSLIFELSPPILYELGLEAAVEWLCNQITKKHGLHFSINSNLEKQEIDLDIKVLLFQVIRELLNNIVKHSKAEEIKVLLKAGETVYTLRNRR